MLNLAKKPTLLFSKRLANIKYSQLIIKDLEGMKAISKLWLKENYILASYIINLVATWQVFIQELGEYGTKELLKRNKNNQIAAIIQTNLEQNIKKFNTPKPENIDSFLMSTLGIQKITSKLKDSKKKKSILNEILQIRNEIAHEGFTAKQLTLLKNFNYMEILLHIGEELETILLDFLKTAQ